MQPYRWLAEHYDELFGPFRSNIVAVRNQLLEPVLKRATSACDLACGTGTTAIELARAGLQIYAVDVSPQMCAITRRKSQQAGVPVRVIRADMRNFRLPAPVDLITCEYDAINHVPLQSDLRSVAKCAFRALKPGGVFCFDVNNLPGFKRYWTGTLFLEKRSIVMIMRSGNDLSAGKAWTDVDLFTRPNGKGKTWVRHSEHVEEVCWSAAEIRRTFMDAGFRTVAGHDAAKFFRNIHLIQGSTTTRRPLVTPGCRSFYLIRK